MLTILRIVKQVPTLCPGREGLIGERNMKETTPIAIGTFKREKYFMGWLRGWWRLAGESRLQEPPNARAHIDLVFRKQARVNLHVSGYDKGKFPWFNKRHLAWEVTVILPLPLLKLAVEKVEKRGLRIKKTKEHKWKVKRIRTTEVKRIRTIVKPKVIA